MKLFEIFLSCEQSKKVFSETDNTALSKFIVRWPILLEYIWQNLILTKNFDISKIKIVKKPREYKKKDFIFIVLL